MGLIEKYGLYLTNERQWAILAFKIWRLEARCKGWAYWCTAVLIAPRTFCICAAVCWTGLQGFK